MDEFEEFVILRDLCPTVSCSTVCQTLNLYQDEEDKGPLVAWCLWQNSHFVISMSLTKFPKVQHLT